MARMKGLAEWKRLNDAYMAASIANSHAHAVCRYTQRQNDAALKALNAHQERMDAAKR